MIRDDIIDINSINKEDNNLYISFNIDISISEMVHNKNYIKKYKIDGYFDAIGKHSIFIIFRIFDKLYYGYWNIINISIVNSSFSTKYFVDVYSNDYYIIMESEI